MMARTFLILISLFVINAEAGSEKTIQEAVSDFAGLESRTKLRSADNNGIESGIGPFPRLRALGAPPKRVALISFNVVVNAHEENRKFSNKAAQKVADLLAEISIPGIKSSFKENGMEVLLPSEFLTDDEKKNFFNSYQIKLEGPAAEFQKASLANRFRDLDDGIATGYKALEDVHAIFEYPSVSNSLGHDLTKALGVDAVLIVNTYVIGRASTWLQNVNMAVFGPNPIKLSEEALAPGGFKDNRLGHAYAVVAYEKDFEKTWFIPEDNEDEDDALTIAKNYTGFDKVTLALSNRIGTYIKTKSTDK
jgi:hypothetical protein